jgi:hypothetical protein
VVIRVDPLHLEELYRCATLEGWGKISAEPGEKEFLWTDVPASAASSAERW